MPDAIAQSGAPFTPADCEGRRWLIRVIRSGVSLNGNMYPAAVLQQAVPLFEGARVLVRSDGEHQAGSAVDFRNLIGRLTQPRFVAENGGEIQAILELINPSDSVSTKLRDAWSRGMTGLFGFSIDAAGASQPGTVAGRQVKTATAITKVNSVDLIVQPGAGGELLQLIEAVMTKTSPTGTILSSREIALAINAHESLPQAAKDRLIERFAESTDLTQDALDAEMAKERDYLARFVESGKVTGLGRVELVEGRDQKVVKMLDAFFDPKDTSVTSIRECYVDITGDRRFTGLLSNCDRSRMVESLGSDSWGDVLGNSIARRMIADYRLPNVYDAWRAIATTVPVGDFRTQERTRFGGYGTLPIVAERGAYLELDSPTDEKATYAVAKRGGTEDVTLEMIANDDVGAIRQIPVRLNRAAKRTLGKFVLDLLRSNPAIYDTVALFHADHGNLGATALGSAPVAAGRLAMMKQTEANSAERLGIGPKSLLVPPDLEETAADLFRRSTNQDKTFIQSLALDVIPVWYWTDTNNWYLAADPLDVPCIEVGFFGGKEEPELFIQDNPSVGSMFANDTITYKIRHIYGATVVNYRGLYGAVVA